jgi:hypothetical protein
LEISSESEKWDLNEILLRALALTDCGHLAEAESAFLEAFAATGSAFTEDRDNLGVAADLYFAYGRLLHEMKRPQEGYLKIKEALTLYSRAYGINDSRTIFCQRKIKELARANNDSDELFRADLFLRAHLAVQSLIAAAFLDDRGADHHQLMADFCESPMLTAAISSVEPNEANLAALADKAIVAFVLELFAERAQTEQKKSPLAIFDRSQQDTFVQECLANPAFYVGAFNHAAGEIILVLVRAEEKTDLVIDLYLDKVPLAENLRKKNRTKKTTAVQQPDKWPCSKLDDLALAFNSRLRKIGREQQFCRFSGDAEGHAAYLLCTPNQFQTVKLHIPLRRLG